jgi:hypothetical protein
LNGIRPFDAIAEVGVEPTPNIHPSNPAVSFSSCVNEGIRPVDDLTQGHCL